jgi:hypothetical protein
MNTNMKRNIIALAGCFALAAATADAQVTTVTSYTFNVPLARVVANPCTTGFALLTGQAAVTVTAVQQTAFQFQVSLTSTGTGADVTAAGLPLLFGAKPDYEYSSDASALATFDSGVPAYFSHTLTVADYLERNSATPTGDGFALKTVLRLTFTNGVPSVPVLEKIAVACE